MSMIRWTIVICAFLGACSGSHRPNDAALSLISSPALHGSAEPALFSNDEGVVSLSWVAQREDTATLFLSLLEDSVWSKPVRIAQGANWFVNWADYPTHAINGDAILASFLRKSGDGKFAYDVVTTSSSNLGASWMEPTLLNNDGKEAEHGFVSIVPYKENFFVSWLDGRDTAMEGMEGHEGHHGQMTVRAAIVDRNGSKLNEWLLDARTCDCCQTTAAITEAGPVVVYRDRSRDEVRDMSIVRLVDGTWTEPKSIHDDGWKIEGCPVNGPRIDARGSNLAIAWFTAAQDKPQVNLIFSRDNGETFGTAIQVNDRKPLGRVDLVTGPSGDAYVSWMEASDIMVRRVSPDGTKGAPIKVATSSEARASGFPQMTWGGGRLVFSWTEDGTKSVKTAVLKVD